MSGEAECELDSKTQNSCRLREVAETILLVCTARGALNLNDLLEAI